MRSCPKYRTTKYLSNLLLLGVYLLASASALHAQAVYGNIVGTVLDASGFGVPGAKITITDTNRDITVTTTSNESGNFQQHYLIASTYRGVVVKVIGDN